MSSEEKGQLSGNPTTPSVSRLEELAKIVEGGVRVRELPTLLSYLTTTTALAILSTYMAVASASITLTYWAYPYLNKTPDPPAVLRHSIDRITVQSVMLATSAQERFTWLVPTIHYLEDEAESDVQNKVWADSLAVAYVTEAFSSSTTAFQVQVLPVSVDRVTGYAYKISHGESSTHYEPLAVVNPEGRRSDGRIVVIPQCDPGDQLLLVLRLSSTRHIAVATSDLSEAIALQIPGRP